MNHFELLGLPPHFTIDLPALEKAYFTQQRLYHPDRFAGKKPEERLEAITRSMALNKAYQALKEPLSRAQYVLSLQGIHVGTEHDSVKPSQELLMEIMELRENPLTNSAVASMIDASVAAITQHYEQANWTAMAQETLRLGYLQKTASEQKP